jgi:zinc/manganese transport system substrate-binding protein
VVDVTETLPAGQDYLTWLDGNRTALARALGAPA